MDMAFSTLVPVPALVAMFYFLLKLVLLFGRDHESSNRCGLPKWVIRVAGIQEFYKDLAGKQNMSTSSLISCPMVSGKHGH